MTDINHVVLVGRVTRDCGAEQNSFGYTHNGTCFAKVSIAVNRSRKDEGGNWVDDASFFDVTLWGKQAENLKPYLTKGKQIAVDGYLKQDRWQKDGQNFSRVTIVANQVQVLTPKTESNQQQNNQPIYGQYMAQSAYAQPPAGQASNTPQPANIQPDIGFPEDIPF
jgi:single-strand DNA-binding protein